MKQVKVQTEVKAMTQQETKNLDALINKISFELVNEKILEENQINKMLGVLANDGVYAWWVYAKKEMDWKFESEEKKFKEGKLVQLLYKLKELSFLFEQEIINDSSIKDICDKQLVIIKLQNDKRNKNKSEKEKIEKDINKKREEQNEILNCFFHNLSEDLPNLLFFREILEKILIYARYHAKAMGD